MKDGDGEDSSEGKEREREKRELDLKSDRLRPKERWREWRGGRDRGTRNRKKGGKKMDERR